MLIICILVTVYILLNEVCWKLARVVKTFGFREEAFQTKDDHGESRIQKKELECEEQGGKNKHDTGKMRDPFLPPSNWVIVTIWPQTPQETQKRSNQISNCFVDGIYEKKTSLLWW